MQIADQAQNKTLDLDLDQFAHTLSRLHETALLDAFLNQWLDHEQTATLAAEEVYDEADPSQQKEFDDMLTFATGLGAVMPGFVFRTAASLAPGLAIRRALDWPGTMSKATILATVAAALPAGFTIAQ